MYVLGERRKGGGKLLIQTDSVYREGPKYFYTALEFRARRRQANQVQAKQALTVVIIIQFAPS